LAANGLPESTDWLFPENDFDQMNLDEYAGVIIERILERGTRAEVNWRYDTFGEERLAEWVRRHGFRLLSSQSFALWRLLLDADQFDAPDWARESRKMYPW
jgi:hypothetical protein